MYSGITSELDFDKEGKQVGYLRLPHSVHRSAYGWIPIPAASIKNGAGPIVLVTAGNHGDEYEGQIIVSRLIREIPVEQIRGQLILLPMSNFPAAKEGTRTSPIDNGNLNRSFPGDAAGTPTQIIANFIEEALLSRADCLIDLHSGGSSLLYDGGIMLALSPRNTEELAKVKGMLRAFGLPRALFHAPNAVSISSAARRKGALSILTELGGAGMSDHDLVAQGHAGVLRLLAHLGLMAGELPPDEAPSATRFMRVNGKDHYVYALDDGVYEPLVSLGDRVARGQPAALVHFPDTPLREPVTVRFSGDGEIVCKRAPALVKRGDCLFQLADDDTEHYQ